MNYPLTEKIEKLYNRIFEVRIESLLRLMEENDMSTVPYQQAKIDLWEEIRQTYPETEESMDWTCDKNGIRKTV